MSEAHLLTAAEIGAAYAEKKLSPVEYTKALIARIERYDGKLNAFLRFTPEIALEEAKRYGLQRSPSFLINGRLAPDPPPFLPPFDFFKRLIEEELGLQAKAAAGKK